MWLGNARHKRNISRMFCINLFYEISHQNEKASMACNRLWQSFKNISILHIVWCLVTKKKKKISDMPVTSCERAHDMTSPSTVVLLWSLWFPSREAKEISSNPISHVTAWLKPEKWNIFPFDVREVFACHRELYMTSKALMIKTSFGPPQPLMVQLMSMRGKGRPQSPASRHIAGCSWLVCYFHWFLNMAGRLSRLKWNHWVSKVKSVTDHILLHERDMKESFYGVAQTSRLHLLQ